MSSNRNGPNTHLSSQLFPNYGQSSNTNDNDNSNNNNINNARSRSGGTGSSFSPNVAGNVRSGAGQGSVNPRISVTQSVSSGNELLSGPSPSRASASAGTSGNSSAGIRTGQGDINTSRFKAPAHKHAHHLHSIPPKEKSTRTLIIDHLLWVHGRTRFAQARAELCMTDRTGGPSSPNYAHRKRPENYEEDDQADSDGEPVEALKSSYTQYSHSRSHSEEEGSGSGGGPGGTAPAYVYAESEQDLRLAQSLRLRTEGLEKVINSMLVQPPPVHLQHFPPPSAPIPGFADSNSSSNNPGQELDLYLDPNQHTLPNGVRVRLALGTLVNDFFARQAPPPPFRHKRFRQGTGDTPGTTGSGGSGGGVTGTHSGVTPGAGAGTTGSSDSVPAAGLLPPALKILASISAYTRTRNRGSSSSRSRTRSRLGDSSHSRTRAQDSSPSRSRTRTQGSSSSYRFPSRTRTLYLSGADPETANSPPAFRCPRHLHTGCEICVEAKEDFSVKGPMGSGRGSSGKGVSMSVGGKGKGKAREAPLRPRGASFAASSWPSTSQPSTSTSTPTAGSAGVGGSTPIGIAPDGGGISGYQNPDFPGGGGCSVGVGEGFLKPSPMGSVLRRRTAAPYTKRSRGSGGWGGGGPSFGNTNNESEADSTGSGYTKLSELVPRFLRLSALVAIELGREIGEGREGMDYGDENDFVDRERGGGGMRGRSSSGSGNSGSGNLSGREGQRDEGYGGLRNERDGGAGFGGERSTATSTPTASSPAISTTKQGIGGGGLDIPSVGFGPGSEGLAGLPPSREWYHLLTGILTRAVLQGYLTAGWRGVDAVECLMGVGLAETWYPNEENVDPRSEEADVDMDMNTSPTSTNVSPTYSHTPGSPMNETGDDEESTSSRDIDDDEDDQNKDDNDSPDHPFQYPDPNQHLNTEPTLPHDIDDIHQDDTLFKQFDPDELPSLREAVRVLFPSLSVSKTVHGKEKGKARKEEKEKDSEEAMEAKRQTKTSMTTTAAEQEFVMEMRERLKKFTYIPPSTPDLSTHMEDLAYEYPAEPVERAAARFCEAVAAWRGKPELEGYKKKPPRTWPSASSSSSTPNASTSPTMAMPLESLVHLNSPTIPRSTPGSQSQVLTTGTDGIGEGIGGSSDHDASARARTQSQSQAGKEKTQKMKMKNSIDLYYIHPDHPDINPNPDPSSFKSTNSNRKIDGGDGDTRNKSDDYDQDGGERGTTGVGEGNRGRSRNSHHTSLESPLIPATSPTNSMSAGARPGIGVQSHSQSPLSQSQSQSPSQSHPHSRSPSNPIPTSIPMQYQRPSPNDTSSGSASSSTRTQNRRQTFPNSSIPTPSSPLVPTPAPGPPISTYTHGHSQLPRSNTYPHPQINAQTRTQAQETRYQPQSSAGSGGGGLSRLMSGGVGGPVPQQQQSSYQSTSSPLYYPSTSGSSPGTGSQFPMQMQMPYPHPHGHAHSSHHNLSHSQQPHQSQMLSQSQQYTSSSGQMQIPVPDPVPVWDPLTGGWTTNSHVGGSGGSASGNKRARSPERGGSSGAGSSAGSGMGGAGPNPKRPR